MPESVPRVLLDTTAIISAGFGRSKPFAHLLRDAADRRVEVIVPEVVVREAVFVYRRRLYEVREALEQLPSLMRAAGYGWDLLRRPALQRRMEDELRRLLAEAHITLRPAPTLDADLLVDRILERRKPTKPLVQDADGRELPDQPEGFRDQLIWEHVRAAAEEGPVIFISDNTSDFALRGSRKDGRAELHADLVDDLERDREAGRSAGDVELILDVETFVREYLQDEDWRDDMQRLLDGAAGEALRDQVLAAVIKDGLSLETFTPPIALQGDVEEATLTALEPPSRSSWWTSTSSRPMTSRASTESRSA